MFAFIVLINKMSLKSINKDDIKYRGDINMRKKIIAGNWKMNKTPSEAVALINELKPLVAE